MNQEKTFAYHDEKKLGQLYILGKTKNCPEEISSYLINLIASAIRREYYDYPERKPIEALKASLQTANIILERFNKQVNFICAALHKGQLYLAQTKNSRFANVNKAKFEPVQESPPEIEIPEPEIKTSLIPAISAIPNFAKALIGFYLIFILILIGSAYFTKDHAQEEQILQFENLFNQAEQKILQAEAVLVFNQADRAKTLLQEAQNIISPLPASSEKKQLAQNIKQQTQKADKIFEIEISSMIDLPEQSLGIIKINKNLYGFTEKNAIFRNNQNIAPGSINIGYFQKATKLESEDSIVFLTDTPGLAIYASSKNKLEKIRSSLPKTEIIALSNYKNYLYFLTKNQIYKYYRALAGFSGPHSWLKQKTEFENPVSFAIDGDIYVLDNNKILKFYRGIREEFNLNFELEAPIKIFTLPDLDYLYILEKNKVLVFNKSGKLAAQYINNKFTNLQDIWVSKDKNIYLLNNQEVLEITLTLP